MSWHPLTFVIKRNTTVYFPNIFYVIKRDETPFFRTYVHQNLFWLPNIFERLYREVVGRVAQTV